MSKPDTVSTSAASKAADLLYEAAHTRVAVAPVRNLIGEKDLDVAYAVQ